jgi:DNA-binding MarR family transcriptional regulator
MTSAHAMPESDMPKTSRPTLPASRRVTTSARSRPARKARPGDDPAPQRNRLALRVHLRLATCRNLLMREARRSIDRWQLTLPQFDVLAELARAGDRGFTFIELSRLLLVTSGNLTGIVDRLERDQLVRRESDPTDRRVIRIQLTPRGRRLTDEMLPAHADDIEAVLAAFPRGDLSQLADLLGRLRDYLHERGDRWHDESAPRKAAFRDL